MACVLPLYSNVSLILNNGATMPAVGLGTLGLNYKETLFEAVDEALDLGYRLFDTASIYGNEKQLGEALQKLLPKYNLKREDVFITTKLSPACCNPNHVEKALYKSLTNLKMDYVDLYLINFPAPTVYVHKQTMPNIEFRIALWEGLIKLYNDSKVRAIGVANFTTRQIKELVRYTGLRPAVNQVEWHPYFHDAELMEYCNLQNIKIQAFCSFGGLSRGDSELIEDPVVRRVAHRYNATTNQVLLAWSLQRGVGVIPKSKDVVHMQENQDIRFKICHQDMERLDCLGVKNINYKPDPAIFP